ncbi:MAG: UDP-N-acetylmuramate dehydrogenase [Clostridiales bacterium]|nr:UDP-N-acetylmuramate dehydrogenase [Clostridiales bacterium]
MTKADALFDALTEKGIQVFREEPMSRHTTFKIGGPAELFICPETEEDAAEVIRTCRTMEIPLRVLGNGSNLLVPDEGLRGAVLWTGDAFGGIRLEGTHKIVCGSGASLMSVCRFALAHALSGLEFAFGIPGSAGGAAYMNAGAYGGEMKDVLTCCRHLDGQGNSGEFAGEELGLSYRTSAYTGKQYLITQLSLSLKEGEQAQIKEKMDGFLNRRKEKQPLEYPSAGSIFKRPEGYFAGTLIEQCGLKGRKVGGAMVSEKHAGFIVNAGGATCSDVLRLIELIQQEVLSQTGVSLQCEVRVMQ